MREIVKADYEMTGRRVDRSEALERYRDNPFKSEIARDIPDGEPITLYTIGEFTDLCRGGHARTHRRDRRRQADERGRRVLARRRAQPDAAAHLRHRISDASRTRRLSGLPRRSGEARPSQARAASSTSIRSRRKPAAAWCSGIPKARSSAASSRTSFAKDSPSAATSRSITPHIVHEKLYEISGHLENFAHGMFGPIEVEGQRFRLKPMNCPGHILIYQDRRATRTAICRSATRNSARSTVSNAAARCTGSRACAASRKTTRISSARPSSCRANSSRRSTRRCA